MKLHDLSDLFDQAVQLSDVGQRDAFIRDSCPNDAARNQLKRLLAAHDQTHCMVDEPEAAIRIARDLSSSARDESPVREGQRIGPYKLLQRIGEGGMGYVFMAEQLEPIQRRVAIKVVKTTSSSKAVLNRFDAERSALARLDHPNITRIIDAGATDSGAPYFVMELVRGDSLTEYCDRQKLTIKERVALVEQVCLALHHAHQKAILHRDIKPSNIMVTLHDGQPIPKIIDFGIAKALDRPLVEGTMFTRYGDMIGTPQYMSPEQAEKGGLDLDVRTDTFSLGAVLFELLTGSPPIEEASIKGKGVLGVLETVRDNDTESPSTRATRMMSLNETVASRRATDHKHLPKLLRGELDWIVLKSLARSRSERYESAAAMARDLRAYLEGGTVDAAAPSFVYQTRKLFQRHRTVGIGIFALALMMLTITAVSFFWAISNNKLQKIASRRAGELSQTNQKLEQQELALVETIKRAQAAEQKATVLANEKKEQAALDRAMRRNYERVLTSEPVTRIITSVRNGRIPDGLQLVEMLNGETQAKLDSCGDIACGQFQDPKFMAKRTPKEATIKITSDAVAQITSCQMHVGADGTICGMPSFAKGLNSLSIQARQMMLMNFNGLNGNILEEFRREFGERHEKVAEALVYMARIEFARLEPDMQLLESRLREAIAIVGNASLPHQLATNIEARILLAEFLQQTGRGDEAKMQVTKAQTELESVSDKLVKDQAEFLKQEASRVTTELEK